MQKNKKILIIITILFLFIGTESTIMASSGGIDFKVPSNFIAADSSKESVNYKNIESVYYITLQIIQYNSSGEAKENMYNPNEKIQGITSFYDTEYGILGYEEIIEDNGKYYYISVYSTEGSQDGDPSTETLLDVRANTTIKTETTDNSILTETYNEIEEFNNLNNITPLYD